MGEFFEGWSNRCNVGETKKDCFKTVVKWGLWVVKESNPWESQVSAELENQIELV